VNDPTVGHSEAAISAAAKLPQENESDLSASQPFVALA